MDVDGEFERGTHEVKAATDPVVSSDWQDLQDLSVDGGRLRVTMV